MSLNVTPTSDPVIIGATGGSGTRIVAAALREAGYFIGTNLNPPNDALEFVEFYDRWNDRVWNSQASPLSPEERSQMEADWKARLTAHLRDMPSTHSLWGWKNPRSIYQLEFFSALFPEMKFVHVTRDGRDMAFSTNQNQLKHHGDAVLGAGSRDWPKALRAAELWNRVNVRAHQFAHSQLGDRYLRIRYEDLCKDPAGTIRRVWDFAGVPENQPSKTAEQVKPPDSLGRWRNQEPEVLQKITAATRQGLELFGYQL